MLVVLSAAAVIWGVGAVLGAPKQMHFSLLGLLFIAVLGIQILFPAGHPLRVATGESAAPWIMLAAFVGLLLAYRRGLNWLRRRAEAGKTETSENRTGPFSESEVNRYARHIVLREIGGLGQKQLKGAKVLVIGAGGLGSPALLYLSAAGIGTIGVVDDDLVDSSNLQRQVIHSDARIGMPKVHSAAQQMRDLNPFIEVRPYARRLTEEDAEALISDYDIVLDGTDNFATRYLVNAACVALGRPLISGALTQWEGQLSVFHPAAEAPCYACVFPEPPADGLIPNCAEAGVVGALPGVIGAMMAMEAIKLITGAGAILRGEMLIYDGLYGETRKIKVSRRNGCACCEALPAQQETV